MKLTGGLCRDLDIGPLVVVDIFDRVTLGLDVLDHVVADAGTGNVVDQTQLAVRVRVAVAATNGSVRLFRLLMELMRAEQPGVVTVVVRTCSVRLAVVVDRIVDVVGRVADDQQGRERQQEVLKQEQASQGQSGVLVAIAALTMVMSAVVVHSAQSERRLTQFSAR